MNSSALKPLETERVILRELTPDDAAFIFELVNDPAWLRFIGDRGVRTLEDARAYIQNGPMAMYVREGFGLWLVTLKPTDTPIGMCGLIKRDALPDVDIGFAFMPHYRQSGYGYEAASATLAYARDIVGLKRVVAILSQDNLASARLLQKLGFALERKFSLPGSSEILDLYAIEYGAIGGTGNAQKSTGTRAAPLSGAARHERKTVAR